MAELLFDPLIMALRDPDITSFNRLLTDIDSTKLTPIEKGLVFDTVCGCPKEFQDGVLGSLLEWSIDPSKDRNRDKSTPLHFAAAARSDRAAKVLIERSSEAGRKSLESYVRATNSSGQTALHIACQEAAPAELAKRLIESIPKEYRSTFIDTRDSSLRTALHQLCFAPNTLGLETSCEALARCLRHFKADESALWEGRKADYYACSQTNHSVMRVLLPDRSPMLNDAVYGKDRNQTPLHLAVERFMKGRVPYECVEYLLDNMSLEGVQKPDGFNFTAWELALCSKSPTTDTDWPLLQAFVRREEGGDLRFMAGTWNDASENWHTSNLHSVSKYSFQLEVCEVAKHRPTNILQLPGLIVCYTYLSFPATRLLLICRHNPM